MQLTDFYLMIFFLMLFILEEWYLLVINKDEDGLLGAKYHDIHCNANITTQRKSRVIFFIGCPLLLEIFPGSLPHLPPHLWVGWLKLL